VKIKLQILVLF